MTLRLINVKSVSKSKKVAVRPLKIRFNPYDPQNPRPHFSTQAFEARNFLFWTI